MIALYLSLFCVVFGFACAYFEITSAVLGFYIILLALPLAVGSMVPIVIPILRKRKLLRTSIHRLLAGIVALVVMGLLGYLVYLNPLNDISTDSNNPPKFEHPVYRIKVKNGEENLGAQFLLDRSFRGNSQVQAEKYKDISPIILKVPMSLINPILFGALGKFPEWHMVLVDKVRSRAELEVKSEVMHFVDDIVVEARPVDANSTQIVMRSRSRVGQSDLGANAKRIIEFSNQIRSIAAEAELKAKVPAKPAQPPALKGSVPPPAKTSNPVKPDAKAKPAKPSSGVSSLPNTVGKP